MMGIPKKKPGSLPLPSVEDLVRELVDEPDQWLDAKNDTTSINPTLDSPQAKKQVQDYASVLQAVADDRMARRRKVALAHRAFDFGEAHPSQAIRKSSPWRGVTACLSVVPWRRWKRPIG